MPGAGRDGEGRGVGVDTVLAGPWDRVQHQHEVITAPSLRCWPQTENPIYLRPGYDNGATWVMPSDRGAWRPWRGDAYCPGLQGDRRGTGVAGMDAGQQAGRVIDELSSSVWAFGTLTAALEAGLLEQLANPQELGAISARSGLDPSLVEGILDVVVALGLVRRCWSRTPRRSLWLSCAAPTCRAASSSTRLGMAASSPVGSTPTRCCWRPRAAAARVPCPPWCSPSARTPSWQPD